MQKSPAEHTHCNLTSHQYIKVIVLAKFHNYCYSIKYTILTLQKRFFQ